MLPGAREDLNPALPKCKELESESSFCRAPRRAHNFAAKNILTKNFREPPSTSKYSTDSEIVHLAPWFLLRKKKINKKNSTKNKNFSHPNLSRIQKSPV
jgi:hypothetical protein